MKIKNSTVTLFLVILFFGCSKITSGTALSNITAVSYAPQTPVLIGLTSNPVLRIDLTLSKNDSNQIFKNIL